MLIPKKSYKENMQTKKTNMQNILKNKENKKKTVKISAFYCRIY